MEQNNTTSTFWTWLNGGYNMPSEEKINKSKGMEEETYENLLEKLKIKKLNIISWFLSGAFNIPSEEKIINTPEMIKDPPPPNGFWAYISGGYNNPKLKK